MQQKLLSFCFSGGGATKRDNGQSWGALNDWSACAQRALQATQCWQQAAYDVSYSGAGLASPANIAQQAGPGCKIPEGSCPFNLLAPPSSNNPIGTVNEQDQGGRIFSPSRGSPTRYAIGYPQGGSYFSNLMVRAFGSLPAAKTFFYWMYGSSAFSEMLNTTGQIRLVIPAEVLWTAWVAAGPIAMGIPAGISGQWWASSFPRAARAGMRAPAGYVPAQWPPELADIYINMLQGEIVARAGRERHNPIDKIMGVLIPLAVGAIFAYGAAAAVSGTGAVSVAPSTNAAGTAGLSAVSGAGQGGVGLGALGGSGSSFLPLSGALPAASAQAGGLAALSGGAAAGGVTASSLLAPTFAAGSGNLLSNIEQITKNSAEKIGISEAKSLAMSAVGQALSHGGAPTPGGPAAGGPQYSGFVPTEGMSIWDWLIIALAATAGAIVVAAG